MSRKKQQPQSHLEALHADALAALSQAEADEKAASRRRHKAEERVEAATNRLTAARIGLKEARADAEANAKAEADAREAAAKHRIALELFAEALGLPKPEEQQEATTDLYDKSIA